MIRSALRTDIDRTVDLGVQQMHRLESHRNPFYATGPGLADYLRAAYSGLIETADAVALVEESPKGLEGFLLGKLVNAPPVYDPGGRVCLIDHFWVEGSASWPTVGVGLVGAANTRIRELEGVLSRIECQWKDEGRRMFLSSNGFTVASDWYCRDTHLKAPKSPLDGKIGVALIEEVPQIVQLCEKSRRRLQDFSPVFWRKAQDSAERQIEFLRYLVESKAQEVLVHRSGSILDGIIVGDRRGSSLPYELRGPCCYTDDFALAESDHWATIGQWLLFRLLHEKMIEGVSYSQVICPRGDSAKSRMLREAGYVLGHEWFVRSV
jgi:hypothetical protein